MYKQQVRFVFKGIIASLLAVLFMAPVVYAQDDADTFMLEEITVTAEKRETNLQDTPVSIQTVSGTELTTEAKQRIDDIMRDVVGVSSQGSQVGTDFYMRGLGTMGGMQLGGVTQSAVAVVIDGVYQNRGEVVRGGTLDMSRAEVMRGTQSTTLGGSSLAGAVSLVSNDPVFRYEGSGSLGIGNYNLVTTQGVLNVPLADSQALRIAYSTEKRDGYLSSNAGNSDLTNARLKYRWQPTETLDLVATWNHQNIGGNGVDTGVLTYYGNWEGYNSANAANYDVTMGDPALYGHLDGEKYDQRDNPWDDGFPKDGWPNYAFRHTTIDQYSADIDWDLGIGTMTLKPSYQKAHFRSQEPPRGNSYRSEDRNQETTQFDAQLTSSADAAFEWLGGIYYYDTKYSGQQASTAINGPNQGGMCSSETDEYAFCWSMVDPNQQTTYAAYGNLRYPVIDTLRINAGLRYTHDEKSSRSTQGEILGTSTGPFDPYTWQDPSEGKWEDVTYRVGGEYDLSDQAMFYVLFATGYQPGTLSMDGATEKQTLDQWTAGLKSRFFSNRLQVNVEGFHSTYHDRPMDGSLAYYSSNFPSGTTCGSGFGPDATPYTIAPDGSYYCYSFGEGQVTIPDLVSKGVDLEMNFLITENDRLDASVEYLRSVQGMPEYKISNSLYEDENATPEITTDIENGLANLAAQYDGLTLQNSPEWTANASYSHIFDLPDGGTLTPKINAAYNSGYWSRGGGPGADIINPAEAQQDAYTLWNAYLNWTSSDDRFNISAYIKNIENKPILTNVFQDSTNPYYVTLAPPRTFGVVFNVKL